MCWASECVCVCVCEALIFIVWRVVNVTVTAIAIRLLHIFGMNSHAFWGDIDVHAFEFVSKFLSLRSMPLKLHSISLDVFINCISNNNKTQVVLVMKHPVLGPCAVAVLSTLLVHSELSSYWPGPNNWIPFLAKWINLWNITQTIRNNFRQKSLQRIGGASPRTGRVACVGEELKWHDEWVDATVNWWKNPWVNWYEFGVSTVAVNSSIFCFPFVVCRPFSFSAELECVEHNDCIGQNKCDTIAMAHNELGLNSKQRSSEQQQQQQQWRFVSLLLAAKNCNL